MVVKMLLDRWNGGEGVKKPRTWGEVKNFGTGEGSCFKGIFIGRVSTPLHAINPHANKALYGTTFCHL